MHGAASLAIVRHALEREAKCRAHPWGGGGLGLGFRVLGLGFRVSGRKSDDPR